MKMFMGTLEGKARNWYEWLEPSILFSLKDFHKVFYKHYIGHCPSLSLAENCCDQSKDLIKYLVNIDEDLVKWHLGDILEEVQEFHAQDNYHDIQEDFVEY